MLSWLKPSARRAPARSRLGVEALEDRAVPASLSPDNLFGAAAPDGPPGAGTATVYTETNNPEPEQNSVLAFRRNPATGDLTRIGSFATGGSGQLNIPKAVGPDDGDQQVQATADGRFLFAVNQGSNSVTAFRIRPDGRLDRVGVFDSGGVQPDSVGIAGDRLYVANRGDAAAGHPGTVAPNVTGFTINGDGSLTPIPNATVSFPVGTFATQTLTARDGRLLFVELATLRGTP